MTASRPPRYSDVQAQAKQAALSVLQRGGKLAAAAQAAIDAADAFMAALIPAIGLEPQMAAIQCGAGCYQCCHQMVGVTAAELALVRDAVAALPEPVRTETRARIKDIADKGKGLSQAAWWAARLRCALLDEGGRCLVHAARPLPCRAMNSSDVGICRRSYDGEQLQIPVLAAQHRVYGSAQLGLAHALAEAQADTMVHGLGTAL